MLMSTKIGILLVCNCKLTYDGFRSLLENHDVLKIIGVAKDDIDAVQFAEKLEPDVIFFSSAVSKSFGLEAIMQLSINNPSAKIIIHSSHSSKRFVSAMLKAGVTGFLDMESGFDELLYVIETVCNDQEYISPGISKMLINDYLKRPTAIDSGLYVPLSDREREVLRLLADGKSSKQIAFDLGIAQKTVDTHRRQVMKKLGFNNIAELVKYAIRCGMISLE